MAVYNKKLGLDWKINADIYYGIEFEKKSEKYSIIIRWADQEITFPKQNADKVLSYYFYIYFNYFILFYFLLYFIIIYYIKIKI